MKRVKILGIPLILAGCSTPTYHMVNRFNSGDVEWSQKAGTASIQGQAFMRTRGGDVKTCAGRNVTLSPMSAYSAELADYVNSPSRLPMADKVDSAFSQFNRQTTCNAQGNFAFTNLPAGYWYVVSEIIWEIPNRYSGGIMAEPVQTKDGKISEILITR